MAKQNKSEAKNISETPSNPVQKPVTSFVSAAKNNKETGLFMFDKINYILMAVGLGLLALGFVLMAGGATTDPNIFPKEEIYSTRRITIAPMVILLGFIVELVAIFYKSPASSSTDSAAN